MRVAAPYLFSTVEALYPLSLAVTSAVITLPTSSHSLLVTSDAVVSWPEPRVVDRGLWV